MIKYKFKDSAMYADKESREWLERVNLEADKFYESDEFKAYYDKKMFELLYYGRTEIDGEEIRFGR